MKQNCNNTPDSKQPAISVLIPVYNVEKLLPRCIDSVLNQTFTDYEIICVNDASPDNSANILQTYAMRDPRIHIIHKESNEGLMMARKTGYENANGKYLFFLDSDDYIPRTALEELYNKAIANSTDITVGQMYQINEAGESTWRPRTTIECNDGEKYLIAILHGITCSLCGSLFKRELFENHKYESFMHQSFSEDRLLLTQLLLKCRPSVSVTTAPTYYYWVNMASLTRRKIRKEQLIEQFNALYQCYQYVNEINPAFESHNRYFLTRQLSYYLEQVPWTGTIRNFNSTTAELLKLQSLRKNVPFHLCVHTFLLSRIPAYRFPAWQARKFIRKLQGKI